MPLGGGVAMLAAMAAPSLAAMALAWAWAEAPPPWLPDAVATHLGGAAERAPQAAVILAGATVLCGLGLWDDVRPMGAWGKLGVQAAVALAVTTLGGVRVVEFLGAPASVAVSVLWILTITNALNFMDNMDGLAASVAIICAAALLAVAALMGQVFVAGWLCLLIGAAGGFWLHNYPPARLFMGDAGSTVLGYWLAVLSMMTTYYSDQADTRLFAVLAPLLALATPLYDLTSVMAIRIARGENPMVGDRRHFSHRLIDRGMTPRSAVATICLCAAVTALAAVLLPRATDLEAALLAAQAAGVLAILALLEFAGGRP
jgi:UDP-GlcNAc:undecaprenyl-phosphate GlcNAc-1-phosphate transferase